MHLQRQQLSVEAKQARSWDFWALCVFWRGKERTPCLQSRESDRRDRPSLPSPVSSAFFLNALSLWGFKRIGNSGKVSEYLDCDSVKVSTKCSNWQLSTGSITDNRSYKAWSWFRGGYKLSLLQAASRSTVCSKDAYLHRMTALRSSKHLLHETLGRAI